MKMSCVVDVTVFHKNSSVKDYCYDHRNDTCFYKVVNTIVYVDEGDAVITFKNGVKTVISKDLWETFKLETQFDVYKEPLLTKSDE